MFCNEAASSELVLDFAYRANEQGWPSYFTIAVEYELASVFAVSLARDQSLAQLMTQQAATSMMRARNLDAQQQTTRNFQQVGLLLIGEHNAESTVPLTNFAFGEVSPSLYSRTDSPVYNQSAQKLKTFY